MFELVMIAKMILLVLCLGVDGCQGNSGMCCRPELVLTSGVPEYGDDTGPDVRWAVNAHLVALTVLYEAAGQPELGQQLVAHTAVNRAEKMGTPYYEVVLFARGQFLGWTTERKMDFTRCQIEEGSDWSCFDRMAFERMGDGPDAQRRWDDLVAMAMAVTQGWIWEPWGYEGVLNFDNPDFWPDGEPPWAHAKEFLGCVGDHCFWR